MKANIAAVLMLILCSCVFADGEVPDVVKKMGLKKEVVEGATIYYEPAFKDMLGEFKKVYSSYREKMAARRQQQSLTVSQFSSQKSAVLDDIYQIVGVTDPDIKTKLNSFADGFVNAGASVSMPLTGSDNVIYLMLQSTSKDYLSSGGTLPNVTYDKATDSAESSFFSNSEKDGSSNQEIVFPFASVDKTKPILDSIFTALPKQVDQTLGIDGSMVIHEIAEMAICERLKSMDPYKRWFTDGFANAITCEILNRHYSKDEVKEFLEGYSTEPCQHLKSTCNLQYWFSMNYSMSNHPPIKQEDELTYARYCFATEQARRIIEAYGIDCVKKIIDQYIATDNKHPGQLLPAIQQATGDDIEKHLMAYQSFTTKEEGVNFYANKMDAAREAKDYPGVAFAMQRILELRGEEPYSKENRELRISIARMLYYGGHGQAATEWIKEYADMLCDSKDPENQYSGREFMVIYAISTHQPQIALEYAEAILESKPEDVYALMVVMINEAEQKHTQKAVELAKKICELEPDDKNPCHALAKSVLAKFGQKYKAPGLTDSMYEKK